MSRSCQPGWLLCRRWQPARSSPKTGRRQSKGSRPHAACSRPSPALARCSSKFFLGKIGKNPIPASGKIHSISRSAWTPFLADTFDCFNALLTQGPGTIRRAKRFPAASALGGELACSIKKVVKFPRIRTPELPACQVKRRAPVTDLRAELPGAEIPGTDGEVAR